MRALDIAVESIAARQCGRFTRAQVRASNGSKAMIESRLRSGRWRRLTSKVLQLPGAPPGLVGDLWTAHLHAGARSVVGFTSAAHLHGFPSVPDRGSRLVVPSGLHLRSTAFTAHQLRDLTPAEVVMLDGLPVTSIPRTLVDLAPEVSRARLEAWLDHLCAERRVDPAAVASLVDGLHGPAARGLSHLVALLGDRLPGPGIEQGRLERALTEVARRGGLGVGIAQHPHPGRFVAAGLVDRAFPEALLIVEADGRRWHERRLANLTDLRRDRAAAAEGWLTVRFTHDDLVRAPDSAAEELALIHRRRVASAALGARAP
jgi:very-short-patch-repair endonuclease